MRPEDSVNGAPRDDLPQRLRESDERYQQLLENSNDIIYTHDFDGQFTSLNRSGERISGYSREEALRMNIRQVLTPESAGIASQLLQALLAGEEAPRQCQLELLTKDGSRVWLEVSGHLQYHGGKAIGAQGIARDITGRKRAEQALRASEERYRKVIENLGEGIAIVDREERFLVVNPAAESIFGVPPGKLAGRNLREFVDAGDLATIQSETARRLQGNQSSYELRIVRPHGEKRVLLVTATPHFDVDGGFCNSIGVFRDITEEKRLEQRINLLAHTLESVGECVCIADSDDRLLFVNQAFLRTYGYEEHELIGQHIRIVWSPLTPAETAGGILPATLAGGWRGELWNRRKDGTDFPVMLATAPVRDESGRLEATVGVARDITKRRQAEEAQRRSEAHLRAAQAVAHLGSWHFDIAQNLTTCSPETHRIYRIPLGTSVTYEWFLDAVHPDDKARVRQAWSAALRGEPFNIEFRILIDGETKWVRESAEIEFDGEGNPLTGMGTVQDITDRKNVEIALRESEAALRQSREELRRLAAGLFKAQEDERRRISRELHDDLSQRLAMLAVEVEMLGRDVPATAGLVRDRLQSLQDQVAGLSDDVRRTAYQLHPSVLEHVGLVAALRSHCSQISKQERLRARFIHRGVPGLVPQEIALCLYRVAQEALRNAERHSGCSEASVTLTGTREGIHLSVEDRGSGFDPYLVRTQGGLGIVSMEERVRLTGGSVSIKSTPGDGTRIDVRIPLFGRTR
jgi:PAS domain S-box-containing protein